MMSIYSLIVCLLFILFASANECSGVGRFVAFQGTYKSFIKEKGKLETENMNHLMILDTCTGKLFICRSYIDLDKGVSKRGCIPFDRESELK